MVTQERIAHKMLNVPSIWNLCPFNVYVNEASLGMGTIVQVSDFTIGRPNWRCNNHETLGSIYLEVGLHFDDPSRTMRKWPASLCSNLHFMYSLDSGCRDVYVARHSLFQLPWYSTFPR